MANTQNQPDLFISKGKSRKAGKKSETLANNTKIKGAVDFTTQKNSIRVKVDQILEYSKTLLTYLKLYFDKTKSLKLKNITKLNNSIPNDPNVIKYRSWDNPFKVHPIYQLSSHSILIENYDFDKALKVAISYFKVRKKQNLIWKKVYYIFPHKDLKVNGYKFFYQEDDDKFIKYLTDQNSSNNFLNYDIKVDRSGIYLKLISELYNKAITIRLLEKKFIQLGITVTSTVFEKIISHKRKWVKIADKKNNFTGDGKATISISDDALKAYIKKTKPESFGREVDEVDVQDALKQARVVYGINQERINQFINEPIYDYPVLIANSNEEMWSYLNQYEESYRINQDSGKEFQGENLFFKVDKNGYILKKKNPKKKNDKTYNVFGQIVDIKKTYVRPINAGEHTYFDEEENLRAEITGTLVKLGNTFHVYEVLTLESVNAKSGDINHYGSIEIEKDIEDGFLVKATGSIHVCGNVGASTLEAQGNIIIDKGVSGLNKAVIKSTEGSVYANFIQNATIHCKEQLIVKTLLSSCKTWVGQSIVAKKPKGTIMGGEFYVYKNVLAQHLGSVAGWRTNFYLGTPIEDLYRIEGLNSRINDLRKDIETKKKEFANAQQYRSQNREKLQAEILNDKNKLEEYLQELRQYQNNSKLVNDEVKVTVYGNIHPGVNVQINNLGFANKYLRSQVEFSVKGEAKKNIFMKKI